MADKEQPQEIHLRIEHVTPLTGVAVAGNGQTHRFDGWLEMMSTIAMLIDAEAPK